MTWNRQSTLLGPLESAIMDHLWGVDRAIDVATLHEAVGSPRGVGRNTIHSTLERLVRKGLLSRRRRGRAYEYKAAVTRTAWVGRMLDHVLGEVGSSANRADVMAGFVDFAERASESSLETLETLVRARLRERELEGEEGGG